MSSLPFGTANGSLLYNAGLAKIDDAEVSRPLTAVKQSNNQTNQKDSNAWKRRSSPNIGDWRGIFDSLDTAPSLDEGSAAKGVNSPVSPVQWLRPREAEKPIGPNLVAELRTNVIVKDEFTIMTDFSAHLAARYEQSKRSIIFQLYHSSCMSLGGQFDPCYVLNITEAQTRNRAIDRVRIAVSLQSLLNEVLGVPSESGVVLFNGLPPRDVSPIQTYSPVSLGGGSQRLDTRVPRTTAPTAKERSRSLGRVPSQKPDKQPQQMPPIPPLPAHAIELPASEAKATRPSTSDGSQTAERTAQRGAALRRSKRYSVDVGGPREFPAGWKEEKEKEKASDTASTTSSRRGSMLRSSTQYPMSLITKALQRKPSSVSVGSIAESSGEKDQPPEYEQTPRPSGDQVDESEPPPISRAGSKESMKAASVSKKKGAKTAGKKRRSMNVWPALPKIPERNAGVVPVAPPERNVIVDTASSDTVSTRTIRPGWRRTIFGFTIMRAVD